MQKWYMHILKECECIIENWEYILWGFIITVVVIKILLKSKYFDDIV